MQVKLVAETPLELGPAHIFPGSGVIHIKVERCLILSQFSIVHTGWQAGSL